MRDWAEEFRSRVDFIQKLVQESGAAGIVYGNSGGKDSALVGILCKAACADTLGVIMPCHSHRNFPIDTDDGMEVAEQFGIETRVLDLTAQRSLAAESLGGVTTLNDLALSNLAPRLRMLSLYAIAAAENRLVAGTGNRSEWHMGYFTKWGDGAHDFNPIIDLTATEIFAFLRHLHAPRAVIDKAPSAGLFEGQTDEADMGVTYAAIDRYLQTGEATEADRGIIERYHTRSAHKRQGSRLYHK
jgi:NAD+ synthase